MTTWQSLLYCAVADVTLERIKNLVAVTGTEPLTVDFKEASTPAVARRSCRPSVMGACLTARTCWPTPHSTCAIRQTAPRS
jgi:hypothetical protein